MNAIVETRQHKYGEIQALLNERLPDFAAVLPKQVAPERFVQVVLSAIQREPKLLDCERRSLFNACRDCAEDGLQPNGREAVLVVYKHKHRGLIAGYIPMIAGIRKKVHQSGEISTFEQRCVYERDQFDFSFGDDPHIDHTPVLKDRGAIIAAYSIATMRNGAVSREVMSIEEIHAIRQRSRAETGPWITDFPEMCRKTVAKRHAKMLPMSSELENLFSRGDAEERGEEPDDNRPERPPIRNMQAALDHIADPPPFDDSEPLDIDHDPQTGEVQDGKR